MPGYQAYGGTDEGSIYQQASARCLLDKFRTHDLSAIHRMVKQIMAREAQEDGTMQPAEERNGLRYLLKFGDFKGQPGYHSPVRFTFLFLVHSQSMASSTTKKSFTFSPC